MGTIKKAKIWFLRETHTWVCAPTPNKPHREKRKHCTRGTRGCECSSVSKHLPGMCEALSSTPSTRKEGRTEGQNTIITNAVGNITVGPTNIKITIREYYGQFYTDGFYNFRSYQSSKI